jgi:hypothetical protein
MSVEVTQEFTQEILQHTPKNLFSEAKSIFKAIVLGSICCPVAILIKVEVLTFLPLIGEIL